MNLHDRLNKLNMGKGTSELTPERHNNTSYQSAAEILQGKFIESQWGTTLLTRTIVPLPHCNGFMRLSQDGFYSGGLNQLTANRHLEIEFQPEKLIYLDTETTGLSGGTGTYPFLVGLGYFKENSFYVDQYLLLDYSEELCFLDTINKFLVGYPYLVTYNGKAFDLPLIKTRYKINRMDMDFDFKEHLDLLHPARQFWKRRLENCSLQQVEQSILGTSRIKDIPGDLIPQIYFDYLANGELDYMPTVFEHNRMDILSLAGLSQYMSQCVDSPLNSSISHGVDFYSMGRFYSIQGDWNNAVACYHRALEYSLDEHIHFETLKELAIIYKRQGQWESCIELWTEMLTQYTIERHYVLEEIAKYYEHKAKDYRTARQLIERFMTQSEQSNLLNRIFERENSKQEISIQKRLLRLKVKESRKQG